MALSRRGEGEAAVISLLVDHHDLVAQRRPGCRPHTGIPVLLRYVAAEYLEPLLLTGAEVLSTITSTLTPRACAAFRAARIGTEVNE